MAISRTARERGTARPVAGGWAARSRAARSRSPSRTSTATAATTSPRGGPSTASCSTAPTCLRGRSSCGPARRRDRVAVPRTLAQGKRGVPGTGERGDAFGAALAAADVDRDGRADLIVGAPGEDHGSGHVPFSGAVPRRGRRRAPHARAPHSASPRRVRHRRGHARGAQGSDHVVVGAPGDRSLTFFRSRSRRFSVARVSPVRWASPCRPNRRTRSAASAATSPGWAAHQTCAGRQRRRHGASAGTRSVRESRHAPHARPARPPPRRPGRAGGGRARRARERRAGAGDRGRRPARSVALVRRGRTVAAQRAGRLGGVVFRRVAPGTRLPGADARHALRPAAGAPRPGGAAEHEGLPAADPGERLRLPDARATGRSSRSTCGCPPAPGRTRPSSSTPATATRTRTAARARSRRC